MLTSDHTFAVPASVAALPADPGHRSADSRIPAEPAARPSAPTAAPAGRPGPTVPVPEGPRP